MKILMINGSARANGNTYRLLSRLREELPPDKFETALINISDYEIEYCTGCHTCEDTRTCVLHDDVAALYTQLASVNVICLASPSYWGYVTGQLKVFFDRSTPYCNTVEGVMAFPAGKMGIALALRAGTRREENLVLIGAIEHYFSHLGIEPLANATFEEIREPADLEREDVGLKILGVREELLTAWQREHSI